MFGSIVFYIGEKILGLYGEEYPLGTLTSEVLNISPEEYCTWRSQMAEAMDGMEHYEKTHQMEQWHRVNEQMLRLHEALCRHRIFRLIQTSAEMLEEARQLTESSPAGGETFEMSAHDFEILRHINIYEDYLTNPQKYGRIKHPEELDAAQRERLLAIYPPIPSKPEAKTAALLICPGPLDLKWQFYKETCTNYARVLVDVLSVMQTLHAFLKLSLSTLEKLTPNHYICALNEFLFPDLPHKWIANPVQGTGDYTFSDDVRLHLVPRETVPGSGQYKIYEYYEAERLQTLLKLDFYKGLAAGHLIRKCELCGRFFLLQKGYHTKYCDSPNPDNPRYSCAQLGYRMRGIKESAADSPLTQALFRCYQRIDKDKSRGNIMADEQMRLRAKAEELYHEAKTQAGMPYAAFNESLASKNLYPLCGVSRKSKPVGRPKKQDG